MVRMGPLHQHVKVTDSHKELFCVRMGTRYKALSAEARTAYGLSPVLVIHDELGQVRGPRSELYDALETSMGAQAAPLSIVISTQAPTDADLLSTLIDSAKVGDSVKSKIFLYAAEDG
jgi:phage terminase large subunit-like protein